MFEQSFKKKKEKTLKKATEHELIQLIDLFEFCDLPFPVISSERYIFILTASVNGFAVKNLFCRWLSWLEWIQGLVHLCEIVLEQWIKTSNSCFEWV